MKGGVLLRGEEADSRRCEGWVPLADGRYMRAEIDELGPDGWWSRVGTRDVGAAIFAA